MATDFNSEITFDQTGNYHKQKIRNRNDLNSRQIGHNVVHDEKKRLGTLRPTRNLPSLFKKGDKIDNEGYVWPQGRILGKYDRRIYTGGAWVFQSDGHKLGIKTTTTGNFYGYIDATGTATEVPFGDPSYGNSVDIEGFLTPFNGTTVAINDFYGTIDEGLGIINPVTGALINSSTSAVNRAASLREAGTPATSRLELYGTAIEDTMRETRNNAYQYQRMITAIPVSSEGYITVPFYVMDGTAAEDDAPGWLTAIGAITSADYTDWLTVLPGGANASLQRAVSLDQTVLFVETADQLATGNIVRIDAWGNPILHTDAFYNEYQFGTVTAFTHVTEVPYAKWVDTYPEMDVTGTGTAGLMADIFKLAKNIRTFRGDTTAIKDIYDEVTAATGRYGWVTIQYRFG